jgi:hypothetical protein
LILKRLFGFATASALAKAWEKKSKMWLSFAGVLVLFQLFDSSSARKSTPKHTDK